MICVLDGSFSKRVVSCFLEREVVTVMDLFGITERYPGIWGIPPIFRKGPKETLGK